MSHRASSYFLSNTSLTAVDKMWRTRVNSEEKVSACFVVFLCEIQHLLTLFFYFFHDTQKTKVPKRVPNPITHEGYKPLRKPRPKPTTAAGLGAASALGGYYEQKTRTPAEQTPLPKPTAIMQPVPKVPLSTSTITNISTTTKQGLQKTNPISGLPPRHHLKLTRVRLKALEKAQIKKAKQHMRSKAQSRKSGSSTRRSSTSSQQSLGRSTGRSTGRSKYSVSSSAGSETARSQQSSAAMNSARSSRSSKSWSSSISIDSQTSNMTEKAMTRIIKLEKALEREKVLRAQAESQLEAMSGTSTSTSTTSSARSARNPL